MYDLETSVTLVRQSRFAGIDPAREALSVTIGLAGSVHGYIQEHGPGWPVRCKQAAGIVEVVSPRTPRSYDLWGQHAVVIVCMSQAYSKGIVQSILKGGFDDFGPLHHSIAALGPGVAGLGRQLWTSSKPDQPGSWLQLDALLCCLIERLLRAAGHVERRSGPELLSGHQLRRSLEMLCATPAAARQLRLRDVADNLSLSEFHFLRAFRNTVGIPPHRYMLRHRLRYATHLIRNTRNTMASIAAETGFSNQAHLNRTLRLWTGLSPADLRATKSATQ